jgi:hypothetical protein
MYPDGFLDGFVGAELAPKKKAEFIGPKPPRKLRQERALRKKYPPGFVTVQQAFNWWSETITMMGYTITRSSKDATYAVFLVHDQEFRVTASGRVTMRPPNSRSWAQATFDELITVLGSCDHIVRSQRLRIRDEIIKAALADLGGTGSRPSSASFAPQRPQQFRIPIERRHGDVIAIGPVHYLSAPANSSSHQLEVIVATRDGRIVTTMVDLHGIVGDQRISAWAGTFAKVRSLVHAGRWDTLLKGTSDGIMPMASEDVPYAAYLALYAPEQFLGLRTILTAQMDSIDRNRSIAALAAGWRYYPVDTKNGVFVAGPVCPGCVQLVPVPSKHTCPTPVVSRRFEVYHVTYRVEIDAEDPTPPGVKLRERTREMLSNGNTVQFVETKKSI